MPQSPNQDALKGVFYSPAAQDSPAGQAPRGKQMGTVFDYYSVADDAKKEAKKLSEEATREFEKASAKAKKASGGIELYTGRYYAACTFGGLLACVSRSSRRRRFAPSVPCGSPLLTPDRA